MPQKKTFRNPWEASIAEALTGLCRYEPFVLPYITHREYTPDFVGDSKTGKEVIIEAKGFFRVGDTQKYKAIRDSLTPNQVFVFILYDPNKKVRKGGKMTIAQWCDKEGIKWFLAEDAADALTV